MIVPFLKLKINKQLAQIRVSLQTVEEHGYLLGGGIDLSAPGEQILNYVHVPFFAGQV